MDFNYQAVYLLSFGLKFDWKKNGDSENVCEFFAYFGRWVVSGRPRVRPDCSAHAQQTSDGHLRQIRSPAEG